MLEDGQVAEVDNLADGLLFQPGSQRLAITRPQPFVGDDDAEDAARPQQPHALLDEIGIQVGCARVGRVFAFRIALECRAQNLLAHIGRVANHRVKAARRHDAAKAGFALPIKSLHAQ